MRPTLTKGIFLGLFAASFGSLAATGSDKPLSEDVVALMATGPAPVSTNRQRHINFERQHASPEVRELGEWVLASGNNRGLPFAIVDKKEAEVFVFYADGRLRGAAPVLLGSALGDDSVPGVGTKKLADIRPEERTTPAGRFVVALDHNLHGKEMLWVDYDAGISMHPVITSNPLEHRAERLATPTPDDNRISYGCINVPPEFFKNIVGPSFRRNHGIVYVLPEVRLASQVFGW